MRTNGTPDKRRVVHHLRARTSESVGICRLTEVFDVADHPSKHWAAVSMGHPRRKASLTSGLSHCSQKGRVDLRPEKSSGRDFLPVPSVDSWDRLFMIIHHVLTELEILSEIHTMFLFHRQSLVSENVPRRLKTYDTVIAVTLDEHVGNRFPRPSITRNQLGNDIQEDYVDDQHNSICKPSKTHFADW